MEDLISKKELLELTEISYGQLYRWKRENLIPEEWFIKRSAYTGQETFFPRKQILDRVAAIKKLKDHHSLEELAKMFDPEGSLDISLHDLETIKGIDETLLKNVGENNYTLVEAAFLVAISKASKDANLDEEEAWKLLDSALPIMEDVSVDSQITLFRSQEGAHHFLFFGKEVPFGFDSGVEVITTVSISQIASSLKQDYQEHFSA